MKTLADRERDVYRAESFMLGCFALSGAIVLGGFVCWVGRCGGWW